MVTSAAVHQLKSRFRGELIFPGDQRYDTARAVFNSAIDRRPALIARCAGRDDVIAAVNCAREEKLLVAVRGTGHNVAGFAVCDAGLVIDLSLMKGITVDPSGAHDPGGERVQLGRGERRPPTPRPRRHRRLRLGYRRFGSHPGRWSWLARAQVWPRA
jgi:hypothetical protein